MRQDQDDRRKLGKGQERITHNIARDLKEADRKRKVEEEIKETSNQDLQADVEGGEVPSKKAKSSKEEHADVEMVPNSASSSGLAGGADGATGETLKRKREDDRETQSERKSKNARPDRDIFSITFAL